MIKSKEMLKYVYKRIPESSLKQEIKWLYLSTQKNALLKELSNIPVVHSGLESLAGRQIPFVILADETILYGQLPSSFERYIYYKCKNYIPSAITEDTIRVCIDVILRYLYPHAMPNLTMPYLRRQRHSFHLQHIETIEDIPSLSLENKKELKKLYMPKPGESFLDIGAYMGYGAIRLSKELGTSGHVIAVEADPEALYLLERNIISNNLSNVTVIPKAIWNAENLVLNFYQSNRQANSLVPKDIINPNDYCAAQTTTVDAIFKNNNCRGFDIISMTVNGAEVEGVEGMKETLANCNKIRLIIAGWYKRKNKRICDMLFPVLSEHNLQVVVGRKGGVLAWK